MSRGTMAARTFEDSAGTSWEVFEVHRSSQSARGVSQGLESGWLAFVSSKGKRRLAPFPADWETASTVALEQLCGAARPATAATFPLRGPRVVRKPVEPVAGSEVHGAVRAFAHEARAKKLPAIEAMVRLRAMLAERFTGSDVSAETHTELADRKRIRQWFVEAFYFDRRA